jgi:hypothetical protein
MASTMSGASSVRRSSVPRYPRSIFSAAAISLIDSYRPSSSSRWYRNARASAFASAGSARVATAGTRSCTGVTTVFRPGRRRMVSGTRTVMLVAVLMPPRSARRG